MRILFVDDMLERWVEFFRKLDPAHHVYYAETVGKACEKLATEPWDLIMLDHDMADEDYADQSREGGGTQIARIMATPEVVELQKGARIVIHSLNSAGSERMRYILDNAGYDVVKVPMGWQLVRVPAP